VAGELTNRLDVFGEAVFDANGRAVVEVGPPRWKTSWRVTNVAVSVPDAGGTAVSTVDNIRYAIPLNQQQVSSNNVLQNDQELAFAVFAGKQYEIEVFPLYSTTVNCDVQTAWSVPAGSTCLKWALGATLTAAAFVSRDNTAVRLGGHQAATAITYQLEATGVGQGCSERGILTTPIDGFWTFQWSQATATVGNLVRFASSYAKITEVL
jgi:hypothetical protein